MMVAATRGVGRDRAWIGIVLAFLPVAGVRGQVTERPVAQTAAIEALRTVVRRELSEKQLPGLSIALADDRGIIWAEGFGKANPHASDPAAADTVYRAGSVSKSLTCIAALRLVERGMLDLDAPVTRYLPDFRPENPFSKSPVITLRHLMSHHAGVVREPPVGNYFDATSPPLVPTVASLNQTALVFEPGTHYKYSNAGMSVVGLILERVLNLPFDQIIQREVIAPLKLDHSSFASGPELRARLGRALMWTYDGRTFDAPMFPLGMAPASNLDASVRDLARIQTALFRDWNHGAGVLLKRESLQQLWTPQFVPNGKSTGPYGLGFGIGKLGDNLRVGHAGAIYGFATEWAMLLDKNLGVTVASNLDGVNAVLRKIADHALKVWLAVRENRPLPTLTPTTPIPLELARRLEGRYEGGGRVIDLSEQEGRLLTTKGGLKVTVRSSGKSLRLDGRLGYGNEIVPQDDGSILWNGVKMERMTVKRPPPVRDDWKGLIGEYGPDYNTLYIVEEGGKLHALIEWFYDSPLTEVKEHEFAFAEDALYGGEKLIFVCDASGRATHVRTAGFEFKRRPVDDTAAVFQIQPVRPIPELEAEAKRLQPPPEPNLSEGPPLVELTALDPTIKLDIRYATTRNFLGTPMYRSARALLRRPAAEALVRAHQGLKKEGFGLLIHDAYRPWYVTKVFWDATPTQFHDFVADPSKGSKHNRGAAVDLTLYDLETGEAVEMVSGYDEFSFRAYPFYPGGTSRQRWLRHMLRRAMEAEGFNVVTVEWWHFDFKGWEKFPILNSAYEDLPGASR
jgi:CubicO group peptidase (beta-lactamase class C family)/D-alanyl-D-alanine dipeptidase